MRDHRLIRTGALVLTGAMLSLAGARPAAAQATDAREPAVQLSLIAPAEADCTSPDVLMKSIEARLGRTVFGASGEPTRSIAVRITPAPDAGWQATVISVDRAGVETGRRQLTSQERGCASLDTALVLVLTTLLGPEPGEREPLATPSTPEPPAPPAPSEQRPAYSGRPTRARAAVPWTLLGALGGALGSGLVPGPYLGAALGLLAEHGPLTLRTGLLALPHAETELGGGARARFAALLGQVAACALGYAAPRGRLSLCAGARVGALFARTSGLARAPRQTVSSAELELSVRYDGHGRGRLGWYTAAGATLPLVTRRYFFVEHDERRRYYHSTKAGLCAELGIILRLPR